MKAAALGVLRAVLAAAAITAAGIWIDDARSTPSSVLVPSATAAVSDDGGRNFHDVPDASRREGTIDLYGNPIEEAVGDYRIDPRGDIFERHSPATEISRLAEPGA